MIDQQYPAVGASAVTDGITGTTEANMNYPAGCTAGSYVLAYIRCAVQGQASIVWPSGWNLLMLAETGAADTDTMAWRKCDGTEGTTFGVRIPSSRFAGLAWRITGTQAWETQPPVLGGVSFGVGVLPQPAAVSLSEAKRYMLMWVGGWEGESTDPPSTFPDTRYVENKIGAQTGTVGVATSNCRAASATRGLYGTTDSPGDWPITDSDDWMATTVAVHPGAMPAAPDLSPYLGTSRYTIVNRFYSGFESGADFLAPGYVLTAQPSGGGDNSTHSLVGDGAQFAGDFCARGDVLGFNFGGINHRGYPTIQLYKDVGVFHGLVVVQWYVKTDIVLGSTPDVNDWISFATFTAYSDDVWPRTVLVNMISGNRLHLMHVPTQGLAGPPAVNSFPLSTWVKLTCVLDYRGEPNCTASLFQEEVLATRQLFNSRNPDADAFPETYVYRNGLAQAHFGLYAAPGHTGGSIWNDNLNIMEVKISGSARTTCTTGAGGPQGILQNSWGGQIGPGLPEEPAP